MLETSVTQSREALEPIIGRIMDKSHPKMVEALYQSAVPFWFNTEVLATIRQKGDQKESGIIERLSQFPFVFPLYDRIKDSGDYAIEQVERDIFNRKFIAKDGAAYLATHKAVYEHITSVKQDRNSFLHHRNLLYHRFFADYDGAMADFRELYRTWFSDRELNAIDELVSAVVYAQAYLALLVDGGHLPPDKKEPIELLGKLLVYVRARIAHSRGNLDESNEVLHYFEAEAQSAKSPLYPYVARLRGYIAHDRREYASAISHFQTALKAFEAGLNPLDPENQPVDVAQTQIDLGGSYAALSADAGGSQADPVRPSSGLVSKGSDLIQVLLSLPLTLYLARTLGKQVLTPSSWHIFRYLDWIRTRFYIVGAKLYQAADPVLEKYFPSLGNIADEKLGYLWLDLGDAQTAYETFSAILEEDEIAPYRVATVTLGQANALLRLGRKGEAKKLIEELLPVLSRYGDREKEADARTYLGEILADESNSAASAQYRLAINLYRELGLHTKATITADQLKTLGASHSDTDFDQDQPYIYPLRFRHWSTRLIQRTILVLFLVGSFFGATVLFRLGDQNRVSPQITFQASPILDPNADISTIEMGSVGSLALSSLGGVEINSIIIWSLIAFVAYVLLITVTGLLAIWGIRPDELQQASQGEAIILEAGGLRERSSETSLKFEQISAVYEADQAYYKNFVQDQSMTIIESQQGDHFQQIILPGNLVNYQEVRSRIKERLPHLKPTSLGFSFLRSPMGALFLSTLAFFTITTILAWFNFAGLTKPLIGFYSVVDLYPWLLMGFYIPIVWWLVIAPTRINLRADSNRPLKWILLAVGLAIFLLTFLHIDTLLTFLGLDIRIRTYPDLYMPLTAIISFGCGALLVFDKWKKGLLTETTGFVSFGMLSAVGLLVSVLIITTLSMFYLLGETRVYHNQIVGNEYRDRLSNSASEDQNNEWSRLADQRYSRAIEIAESSFFVSLLRPTTLADIYVSRGMMRLGLESSMLEISEVIEPVQIERDGKGDSVEEIQPEYSPVINDLNRAVMLVPGEAKYLLWRGYIYQSQGDFDLAKVDYLAALAVDGAGSLTVDQRMRTETGLGWIAFQKKEYLLSEEHFQTAADTFEASYQSRQDYRNSPDAAEWAADAYLGLGYAIYVGNETRERPGYEAAQQAWERAVELDPTDALALINLGTSHWRQGTLGEGINERGQRVSNECSSIYQPPQRERAEQNLLLAADYLRASTRLEGQTDDAIAFTWRTLGQFSFLLGQCPSQSIEDQFLQGVDNYAEAVRLDPSNAHYWNMRGRLAFVAWQVSTLSGPPARFILMDGLDYAEMAVELAPDVVEYQNWYQEIRRNAESGSINRGNQARNNGDYETAFGYYQLVAERITDNTESSFLAAEMRLALNDIAGAADWYRSGIERARTLGDEQVIVDAFRRLPQNGIDEIRNLFSDQSLNYSQPTSALEAFNQALALHEAADFERALNLFEIGLKLADQEGSLAPVRSGLLQFLQLQGGEAEPYLAQTRGSIAALRQIAARQDKSELAFDLGIIGLTLNDLDLATIGFNEGIRRTTLPSSEYRSLQVTQNQLRDLWLATGWSGRIEPLLAAMDADLVDHFGIYPELEEDGNYWRYRGWFKYQLAGSALRVGDEQMAQLALDSAQPDADRAKQYELAGRDEIDTYLKQGALGWFFLLKGDDAISDNDLTAALWAYLAGIEAFSTRLDPSNLNSTAANEYMLVYKRAIKTALLTNEGELAQELAAALLEKSKRLEQNIGADVFIVELEELALPDSSRGTDARQEVINIFIQNDGE